MEDALVEIHKVLSIGDDPERLAMVFKQEDRELVGLIDCPKPDLLAELNRRLTERIGVPLKELHALEVPYRGQEEVKQNRLWPPDCLRGDPRLARRCRAVMNVLMRIPPEAWRCLGELANAKKLLWFIPSAKGAVMPFEVTEHIGEPSKPYAVVVYVSPLLENEPCELGVAVVAHELAHLILGHRISTSTQEAMKAEKVAWDLVERWGFEKEARLHPEWPANQERIARHQRVTGLGHDETGLDRHRDVLSRAVHGVDGLGTPDRSARDASA